MRLFRCVVALPLLCMASLVSSHELEANLLTVVMRDGKHISMTFRIDEVDVMRRMLSGSSSETEFLLPLTAMSDDAFARVVLNFRKRFEQEVQLLDARRKPVPLAAWRWPAIADSRKSFRQQIMQGLVGGANHEHMPPTVITVDGLSSEEGSQLELALPHALDGITVVHYRPTQRTWHAMPSASLNLDFR